MSYLHHCYRLLKYYGNSAQLRTYGNIDKYYGNTYQLRKITIEPIFKGKPLREMAFTMD